MADISKTVFCGNIFSPLLDRATFDFYCLATTFTDQVMVMTFTAKPVDRLAIFATQDIDEFILDQCLQ